MLYLFIAALIVLGDQLFKYWVSSSIPAGSITQLIPGVIHLTYIPNTGAAFNIMEDMRWLLVAIEAICIVVVNCHHVQV